MLDRARRKLRPSFLPVATLIIAATALAADLPPKISGTPVTLARAGAYYYFQPTASDPEGKTLKFSSRYRPSWANLRTDTGALSGYPPVGTYSNIIIRVSDGVNIVSLPAFTISAVNNRPPTIIGTPSTTAQVSKSYSFLPKASDPDGQKLTFSIQNKPAWTTFSTTTGQLSGTPTASNVGRYSNITIRVSDGISSAALPAFLIDVKTTTTSGTTNTAPTISGTPAKSVNAASTYSFQPTASDANSDPLTFSIANRPSWASFSASTGKLSGTPSASNIGTYSSIVISVSDGKASVSLPSFSIAVTQYAVGAATLSWMPPTQNTDGSVLTNLSGYRIYYGTSPSALNQTITLNNPGLTTYIVQNLSPATYYFAVKALASTGVESSLSTTASKTIQ
jgi:Putative Ig domain